MKIGLVFDDSLDRPDGVQQYVLALGAWFSSQGHEVHYLVGQTRATVPQNIHSLANNINVRFNGNRLSIPRPVRRRQIRELLQREQFDVLHVMMPYSPFFAARVVAAAAPTTVVSGIFHILPQSGMVRRATYALGWWLRRSLRRFDVVFATSPAAKRFAEQAFALNNVIVSPNVVAVDRFRLAEPFERYRDGVSTIMFLGRLVPRKGCQLLLEAMASLNNSQQSQQWRLVVCGKGPLESALKQQAEQLGIGSKTEFTGFISEADKPRFLASADLAVFPSTGGESFGIVLVEAMAASRPVVLAAANPGYACVMEPRPEQLFAPGEIQALAETIQTFLDKPAAHQAAKDWQDAYVGQFDTAVVGRQLLDEYTAQLQNKQRS